MEAQLLEKARIAKQQQDSQQALIDQLPELERQAHQEAQQTKMSQQKAIAQTAFEQAIEAHQQRDETYEANYNELRRAFRLFVAMLKSDNRSYDNVWAMALQLGYFLAAEDTVFGLTADSQRAHAQELMKINVPSVNLPHPADDIDELLAETDAEYRRERARRLWRIMEYCTALDGHVKLDAAINRKLKVILDIEDRIFLNPAAKVRTLPIKRKPKEENPIGDLGFDV